MACHCCLCCRHTHPCRCGRLRCVSRRRMPRRRHACGRLLLLLLLCRVWGAGGSCLRWRLPAAGAWNTESRARRVHHGRRLSSLCCAARWAFARVGDWRFFMGALRGRLGHVAATSALAGRAWRGHMAIWQRVRLPKGHSRYYDSWCDCVQSPAPHITLCMHTRVSSAASSSGLLVQKCNPPLFA